MFEWLEKEISEIKTPLFHVVDGPADQNLREAVTGSNLPVPDSYKAFVLQFGNAKLYRNSRNGYRVHVYASPREATLKNGQRIYHIGNHDGARVYVKGSWNADEIPIYEFDASFEEKAANTFEKWLKASCARARRSFTKEKWAGILRGPEPFSAEEKEIIKTRRKIDWRFLGIDSEGDHIFEVTNKAQHKLSFLTVGVRSKSRHLNGAAYLQIENIAPGETGVLHKGCYKELVPAEEIEVFNLPDPKPEEREFYWEFRKR